MPAEYTDLEIYIRPAKSSSEDSSRHDVEAKIDGAGLWRDEAILDEAALGQWEEDPVAYGKLLYKQLFAGRIEAAYHRARGAQGGKVRVRILLDAKADRRHWFRWERLYAGDDPMATTPVTPFSRCLLAEETAPIIPDDGIFHLVVAVANPSGLPQGLAAVDVAKELSALARAFEDIADRSLFRLAVMPGNAVLPAEVQALLKEIEAKVIPGPVTLEAIKAESQSADGLHLIAHGKFDRVKETGFLYLEDAQGGLDRIDDQRLKTLRTDHLKLVYLQACESGARAQKAGSGLNPAEVSMVGVAAQLLAAGIPAVVAMQQPVEMQDARLMARAFYQSLIRDGAVDLAVNAGRQAIQSSGGDRWSVPALYMRLSDGRLWHADPFREALRGEIAKWEREHDMATPVPLQASKDQDAERATHGSYDVTQLAIAELRNPETSIVILAGDRGSGKTAVLDRVAWTLAGEFLEGPVAEAGKDAEWPGEETLPVGSLLPVRFALGELAGRADLLRLIEERLRSQGRAAYGPDFSHQLTQRSMVLMVDGEEDVVPARRGDFLQALRNLPENFRLMLTVDSLALEDWLSSEVHSGLAEYQPSILRMQPMERAVVMRYLSDLETKTKKAEGQPAEPLAEKIQRNRWWDLTSQAWMLRRMIRYCGVDLKNRAGLFDRVTAERLANLDKVTRSCAEQALTAIAWKLQQTQEASLAGGPLYELLAEARRGREYPLSEIRYALIHECEILRRSGEDGVRFAYSGFQAYYAALYLLRAPDRERKLDDIVATLGSGRHLRLWEETLVILAGMMDNFGRVLSRILAGSSAATGEQVYLAATCYLEIPPQRQGPELQALLRLLVDTLIWRSHPTNDRSISDRKKAIRWLTELETGLPPGEDRAIEHLVRLACDPVGRDWSGKARYEFSGIRLEAVNVMLARRHAISAYVLAHRQDLTPLLLANAELVDGANAKAMIHVMNRANDHESPLAVFALGLSGRSDVTKALVEANAKPGMGKEVLWAIAEMLPRLDPEGTLDAIRPLDKQEPDARLVYMINKVGRADRDVREYLLRCLLSRKPRVIGRAARTLAEMGDERMKQLCENLVRADWAALRASGLVDLGENAPNEDDTQSLQHAALEGLRSAGDEETIEILQKAWLQLSKVLSQLSYDVTESIYWRLSSSKAAKARQPQ